MRILSAVACALGLALAACGGDDGGESSLETFCAETAVFDEINAQLLTPPFDASPEEVEALANDGLAVVERVEAAAPEDIKGVLDQLVAFDEFVDAMRQNDWDVEASLDDFDELVAGVDPAVIAEYNDYVEENCRSGSE